MGGSSSSAVAAQSSSHHIHASASSSSSSSPAKPTALPSSPAGNTKPSAAYSSTTCDDVTLELQEKRRLLEKRADEYREKNNTPTQSYIDLALHHLSLMFNQVNQKDIKAIMEKNGNHFFKTREAMRKIVYGILLDPEEAAEKAANASSIMDENLKKAG